MCIEGFFKTSPTRFKNKTTAQHLNAAGPEGYAVWKRFLGPHLQ